MSRLLLFNLMLLCLSLSFHNSSLSSEEYGAEDSVIAARRQHRKIDSEHPGWGYQSGYFGRHHGGHYNLWNREGYGELPNGWGGSVHNHRYEYLRRSHPSYEGEPYRRAYVYPYYNYFDYYNDPIEYQRYYYFYPRQR